MVKLKLNSKEFEAEVGQTILELANANHIEIPTLCYHKTLEPYGACRLCTVEINDGRRSRLVSACTFPVKDGIEVKTDSEQVVKARKVILELLLARCPNSEDIKEMAKKYGVERSRFRTLGEINDKCILCGLCVRVCQDVMGVGALCFANRGVNRTVTTPFDQYSSICTTCGACEKVCPTDAIDISKISKAKPKPILSEYERGMAGRNANYIPFPQAVPNKPVIDREHCMHFKTGKCGACEHFCEVGAIDYTQEDRIEEIDVGAIIVATGFDLYNKEELKEYGYGEYEDVLDGLQFERLLAPSGPTNGKVLRPSDGKEAETVVFIQCCGSRDPELGVPYCSRVCCMYVAKQALLYKHAHPDGQAFVFYIDIRTAGKGYEEFTQRAMEEEEIIYLRGKVSKVYRDGDKVIVMGVDTLTGKQLEIEADIVVLATAIVPSEGVKELASKLRISTDEYGFIKEAHLKLRPAETLTSGIYLAGMAQSPKDITDSVAQGSAAASKILSLFSKEELLHDPTVAFVDLDVCAGCGSCEEICAYQAVAVDPVTKKAQVNELVCEGCGACAATCPSGAIQHKNYRRRQIYDMIDIACEEYS
ncbi:4Fe-4S binding protein [[Eubacterium] cellulosolvens]